MADESNEIKEEVKHDQEILRRVFNILRENSPELVGVWLLTIIWPPQVLREGTETGTQKTVFVNFMDYCKTMRRPPDHVMAILLGEMGTRGTLDGQQRLVVRGRFTQKHFESLLRRYILDYVMCSGCKSTDAIISRENRLSFLRCEKCGSERPVGANPPEKNIFLSQEDLIYW
ncbi:translation initiation factor [Arabidopsis lyrata subsp. lyrata]|uniref:Eukaryotic translation initiation factor 2 subunit beta n=1 Tax=Arabidopsis lyrata subsp. lyrata TaxID=81972 RepID=D7L729_ARALL|nr:eukaryotic translation initiation factor 2 subunit beta [Arabidopsis lyrata subsp. lyrata]EFH60932.1 translation initiation factor [Arabidopsis lyrata subsp. lyrata]|eukprot:XP_002884673.1 eukaryotic translation initiation factor 2 subunit beta [Arabidopsis lyrata subsp. lyrata]